MTKYKISMTRTKECEKAIYHLSLCYCLLDTTIQILKWFKSPAEETFFFSYFVSFLLSPSAYYDHAFRGDSTPPHPLRVSPQW